MLSESHMSALKRASEKVAALSIELIESNNESAREQTYKLIYFIVYHFPLAAFIGKGCHPLLNYSSLDSTARRAPLNSRRQTAPPTSR